MTQKPGDEKGRGGNGFTQKAGQAIALGTNLAVGVGLFTFLGYYADSKRGGGIFWTMCGVALGLVYGAYEVWKVVMTLSSDDGANDNPMPDDLRKN